MSRLKSLRVVTIVMLALLAVQFELGMAVNLSPALQEAQPLPATPAALWSALTKVGGEALTHAILGTAMVLVGLAGLVLAAISGARSVLVLAAVGFAALCVSELSGILFTLSGFRNDGDSHGMATGFLLAFSLYFVQVCVLWLKLRRV